MWEEKIIGKSPNGESVLICGEKIGVAISVTNVMKAKKMIEEGMPSLFSICVDTFKKTLY